MAGVAVLLWLLVEVRKLCDRRRLDQQINVQSIADLSWLEFESLVSEFFHRQGYVVEQIGGGLTNESVRWEKLRKQQQAEQDKLRTKQRREEEAQAQSLQQERTVKLREERKAYLRKADDMKLRQRKSIERLKVQQQALTRQRNEVIKTHQTKERQRKLDWARQMLFREEKEQHQANDNPPKAKQKPEIPERSKLVVPKQQSANSKQPIQEPEKPTVADQSTTSDRKPTRIRRERKERQPRQSRRPRDIEASVQQQEQQPPKTRPADLLPQNEKTSEAARQIDDFKERMMKQLKERFDQEHDREDRER